MGLVDVRSSGTGGWVHKLDTQCVSTLHKSHNASSIATRVTWVRLVQLTKSAQNCPKRFHLHVAHVTTLLLVPGCKGGGDSSRCPAAAVSPETYPFKFHTSWLVSQSSLPQTGVQGTDLGGRAPPFLAQTYMQRFALH